MRRGKLIVIEGTDGSGKTTQFRKLIDRLEKEGYPTATFDFPQYTKPSSYFVKEYLNGRYGTLREVGPYRASLFYALDRFDVAPAIRKWLDAGKMVLTNRYVSSNLGHQGAKIRSEQERKKYFKWVAQLEYDLLGVPKPDLGIVLHVPALMAHKLIDRKGSREYIGGVRRDIHETDLKYLKQAEETYLEMTKIFPRDFTLVECLEEGKLLSVTEIHERVWKIVLSRLSS